MPTTHNVNLVRVVEAVSEHVCAYSESGEDFAMGWMVCEKATGPREALQHARGLLDAIDGISGGQRIFLSQETLEAEDVSHGLREPGYFGHFLRRPLRRSSSQVITRS